MEDLKDPDLASEIKRREADLCGSQYEVESDLGKL